jgi:hypothetical protein
MIKDFSERFGVLVAMLTFVLVVGVVFGMVLTG